LRRGLRVERRRLAGLLAGVGPERRDQNLGVGSEQYVHRVRQVVRHCREVEESPLLESQLIDIDRDVRNAVHGHHVLNDSLRLVGKLVPIAPLLTNRPIEVRATTVTLQLEVEMHVDGVAARHFLDFNFAPGHGILLIVLVVRYPEAGLPMDN
jgi:hypothetical protein